VIKQANPTEMKQRLNKVGPGFCLAKWTQLTLNLQNGTAHSCHHPPVHQVPVDEIKLDPSSLHNSIFKKQQRKMMLEGGRPKECDYCWRVEDADPDALSDRHLKSSFSWSNEHFDKIKNNPWDANFQPSYVEVSFGYACNFKCLYCSPAISSSWMQEVKQHGGFSTTDNYNDIEWTKRIGRMPIPEREYNPYVEAFWKWWPDLYPALHTFRVTGGEPLMNKNTFKMMDWIIENDKPNTNLLLGINSNFCVDDKLFNKFINQAHKVLQSKKVRKLEIYTSAEAQGEKAEYIRTGFEYKKFFNNMDRVLNEFKDYENFVVTLMCTFNALSVSSFKNYLQDLVALRKKYGRDCMYIDIPYLRYPEMMDIKILDSSFEHYITDTISYMQSAEADNLMHESETAKLKRILEYWRSVRDKDQTGHKTNFKVYARELDSRRNTDFLKVFPEYSGWYNAI
tara:strand:+ start:4182 stop:5537 length:1356 start_codon:yes stop_codon:yes gene_type:complete